MFKIKKYKIFSKLKTLIYVLPRIRLSKFKRPKWKALQRSLKRICLWRKHLIKSKKKLSKAKPCLPFINNLFFNSAQKEQRLKKHYKNSLNLKRTLAIFFHNKLSTSDFKKLIFNRSSYTDKLWLDILIKPLYILEVLLCKLGFFKTIFELRQSLINQEIYVNNRVAVLNMVVKKGDFITMPFVKLQKNTSVPMLLSPLVEADYYNNTVIILIDYLNFNLVSLPAFYPERLDIVQLIDYIKNK